MIIATSNVDARKRITKEVAEKWSDSIFVVDSCEMPPVETELSNCIGVCDTSSPKDIIKAALTNGYRHLISTEPANFASELGTAAKLIENPQLLFQNPSQCLLSVEGELKKPSSFSVAFNDNSQKAQVFSAVSGFFNTIPRIDTIRDSVEVIVRELFTNAMCAKSKSTNPGEGKCEINVFQDGTKLVIGCRDPFGGLDPNHILWRIFECYERGVAASMNMDERQGGAGIGCYMMFQMSQSLILAVEPGKQSAIYCVLPLGLSYRNQAVLGKNLHVQKLQVE